jgi:hypothetical protein
MREKVEIREHQKAVFTTLMGDRITVMLENNALFVRGADGWRHIDVTPERAGPQSQERP